MTPPLADLNGIANVNFTVDDTFAPPDVPGCDIWLAADNLSLNDGDPVDRWGDESGNGNDFVNSSSTSQPTFRTNVLNGKPVVRFDGSNDFLDKETSYSNAPPYTIFTVYSAGSGSDPMAWDEDTPNDRVLLYHPNNSTVEFHTNGTHASMSKSRPFSHYINEVWVDGSDNIEFLDNGSLEDSRNETPRAYDGTPRLGDDPGDARELDGDIAEYIVYDNAISTADREEIRTYLADKYGFTIA